MYTAHNEQQVCFNIEVRVPFALAAAFADALTGNDDDIILAAETAMRDHLDARGAAESIELSPEPLTGDIQAELRRAMKRAVARSAPVDRRGAGRTRTPRRQAHPRLSPSIDRQALRRRACLRRLALNGGPTNESSRQVPDRRRRRSHGRRCLSRPRAHGR